ncbi:hypothetical protein R6Q59_021080 [Mikania micrantha]
MQCVCFFEDISFRNLFRSSSEGRCGPALLKTSFTSSPKFRLKFTPLFLSFPIGTPQAPPSRSCGPRLFLLHRRLPAPGRGDLKLQTVTRGGGDSTERGGDREEATTWKRRPEVADSDRRRRRRDRKRRRPGGGDLKLQTMTEEEAGRRRR